MANLFQAWDEDIQALGAAKASDDQIEARRQQLAEHFKAKAKAAGLSSKKINETLDYFDTYSRQNSTNEDNRLSPEEEEMAQRVKDGTERTGAMLEVGKRFKDIGLGALSSLTRMGGDIAQTVSDVGDNDKSELSSQIAQGLYNATDDIRSNYSEGTKQAKKDFWSPEGLTMGLAENLGQIAGSATVFGAAGKLAAARKFSRGATLLTAGTVGAPLAYSQGYGQGKENSLDEINKTSNAQLWENVKAEAKAYDDAGGTGEVPYLVKQFKEAGGDLNLMKDLMAENAGNVTGLMTVATEPLAMGVGSLMSRGAAAGGKGLRAGLVNAMNNQGMSNELARRIAAGGSAGIASQLGKIGIVQGTRGTFQEGTQEGGEGYIAKTEGSLAAGRKGELTGEDWRGEHGIIQQGLQGAAIGGIMAGGSVYSSARNASKLALEKKGLPEKHDAAIIAKKQADAALAKAANIADANPNNIDAQNAYAEAQDAALVATNDLEQLTGKFNALYTPEEQAVIKAKTMEGIAARKKVADDAAKAQKELDDAQAKAAQEQQAQQAEILKAQRDEVISRLVPMLGDDVAVSNELASLGLSDTEANTLLTDAHKEAKAQKKAQKKGQQQTTPKTPFELAVDEAFNAKGERNNVGSQDIADKHGIKNIKTLIDAISERIDSNAAKTKAAANEALVQKRQADKQQAEVLSEKQQLENTLADFAANNDHDSMVNFLRDYDPKEADTLIANAYKTVANRTKAEQDAITASQKAEAAKAKKAEDDKQAEQKKAAFTKALADLHATNPDATMADLNAIGKKHSVKSPIELAKAWVKVKNEAKAAKEAAPKLGLPSPETATKDERDVSVPTGLNVNRDNIENQASKPIVRNDGTPFPTEQQAKVSLERKSQKKGKGAISKDTHEVIPVDGGFAIAPVESQPTPMQDDVIGEYAHNQFADAVANVTKTDKGYDVDWGDEVQSFTGKNAADKTQAALKKENFNKKNPDDDNGGVAVEPVAPKPVSPMNGNSTPQATPKTDAEQIASAMDKTAKAITDAAHSKVVERVKNGEEIVYKQPAAIERAKQDDRYQVEINDKGHAVVKNVKDSSGEWVKQEEKTEENNSEVERIASLYAAELGHPVSKRSREFANDILNKNAYGLEFLANGMNDKGKKVFTEVTGISLPKQQGATWKVIRDWAGVSDEQENHRVAMRDVAYAVKAFMRDNNVSQDVADKNKELIASKIAEGFNSIEKIGNNYWFTDGKGQGINLSEKPKKGYLGLSKSRALIEAMIAEAKAAKAKEINTKDKAIFTEEAKQDKPIKKSPLKATASKNEFNKAFGVNESKIDEIAKDFERESQNNSELNPQESKQPTKKETLLIKIDDELDAALDDLAAIFKEQGNRLSSGVDPVIMGKVLAIGMKASTLYLAKGAVKFAVWAENIIAALSSKGVPQETVQPYLKGLYLASKAESSPEIRQQMDKEDDVYNFDFAILNESTPQDTQNVTTPSKTNGANARERDKTPESSQAQGVSESGLTQDNTEKRDDGVSTNSGGRGDRGNLSNESGKSETRSQESNVASTGGKSPKLANPTRSTESSNGANLRNYRIQPNELKRTGSWKATAEQNVQIVELVKTIIAENRAATPEEKALLTKFTGWGASEIANGIFPNQYGSYKDANWKALGERLEAALTTEEYAQAKRTTQYAHYTSEPIIRSVYAALSRFGFNGGSMVEPGMGVGLFNGLMPDAMANNSQYTGIEYDTITGNIAKLLYPDSNVIVGDFTETKLPKNFFDVAIGNPPFGSIKIQSDPEYKKQGFLLHDYFFAKTIDRVKEGGLLVFVTSKGTMDKTNDRARKYLSDRADLVGAIRLPQTAFKDNAGTEVVTDVIFLRKRTAEQEPAGEAWGGLKEITTPQGKASINEYFATHPEMILGKSALTGSMYRANEYTVEPIAGSDIETLFSEAINNLPENIYTPQQGSKAEQAAVQRRDYDPKIKKEGGIYVADDGVLMQVNNGQGTPLTQKQNSKYELVDLSPKEMQWLNDYVGVRDALKQAQYDQLQDNANWQQSLDALNKSYDAFVKKHGFMLEHSVSERENEDGTVTVTKRFKNKSIMGLDAESALINALEQINGDNSISKAPALLGRVINKPSTPVITSTQDAMFVVFNELGRFDLAKVAKLINKSEKDVVAELGDSIYQDPSTSWTTADDYLSGNVVRKLKEAEQAARLNPKYQRNVAALKAVQPPALAPQDINVQLGAAWIPDSDVAQFVSEVLEEKRLDVSYSPLTGQWTVNGTSNYATEWRVSSRTTGEIFESVLNNRQIKITYTDINKKVHTDTESTEKANDIAKKMREAFKRWLWQDVPRTERLVTYYNEHFNNIAPRSFDGQHLTLPGVSSRFDLRPHQKRAIWRTIQQGDVYYAHAVGAGKTFTMIASGMEERRLGLVKKPMYVVPNHMLAQFSKEFLELYPMANIMVADEANFHTHNRRKFVAQAALNNPDAIVITHSAFGRIGISSEYSAKFIKNQIADWQEALQEVGSDERITRKQIERRIEQLENKLKALLDGAKDQLLNFEELGVDRLYVDEGHEFRKLDFPTNRGNIKGIDPSGSQKSMDLYMKVEYLRSKNPNRALVMASGTPVTNTMGELFTVQRFFNPSQLEEDGDSSFDAWSAHYGEVVDGLEQNAAGGYETVSRFAKFVNVPELMSRVRYFMDILTSNQLGDLVQRPDVVGGGRQVIVTPAPDGYKEYQKDLERRIKAIRDRKAPPKAGDDIILSVIADGRFSAIDMRFVDATLPSDPNSKLNRMLDDLISAYHETANNEYMTSGAVDENKGSSLMLFTDIGLGEQSAKNRGFDMKAWIEKRLVEGGVKREHIAFMRDNKAHSKKEKLFDDMRQGKKRILIGGKDMETGVNAQKRLVWLGHLDAPWFPASVEQREGRAVRQGNQNKRVTLKAYATKGSYDSTMWGMNSRKARFIEQAMSGDASVRSMEDVSEASAFEMAAALASGDERYLKLAGLKGDVERLSRLYSAHIDEQKRFAREKAYLESNNKHSTSKIEQINAAIAQRKPIKAGEFLANVGKNTFDNREDFSKALFEKFKEVAESYKADEVELGSIAGFPIVYNGIELRGGNFVADLRVDLPIDAEPLAIFPVDPAYSVSGIATRAVNQTNALDKELVGRKSSIEQNTKDLARIGRRIGASFPEMAELNEKQQALNELEQELNAEGKVDDNLAQLAPQDSDSKPKFSQSSVVGDRTVTQVRDKLISRFGKRIVELLESKGILKIHQSIDDNGVPKEARLSGIEGFYFNGTVHLIADNLTDETIIPTFVHELSGHKGFQEMMSPKAYELIMTQFNRLVEAKNPIALAAKQRAEEAESLTDEDKQGKTPQQILNMEKEALARQKDEYLPYLITEQAKNEQATPQERNAIKRLIDHILRAVKGWVVRHLGKYDATYQMSRRVSESLTPADILYMAERMVGDIAKYSGDNNNSPKFSKTEQSQFDRLLAKADKMIAEQGKLLAPNGKPSKLNRYQWAQVRTDNFKNWFGDWENDPENSSKAVDENGEPMVVYHGTSQDVSSFDVGRKGSHFGTLNQAQERGLSVMPTYLSIKNPKRTKDTNAWSRQVRMAKDDGNDGIVYLNRVEDADLSAMDGYSSMQLEAMSDTEFMRKFGGNDSFIAFDPTQIKSAIGNTGDFNPTNPDIRFSRKAKNPITEGIKSAANDAKNSLPTPIAKSIDNFMAGRRLPSSDMANITAKTELSLYHRTIGTQQNTALQNADFKKVYDIAQRYLQHVAVDAYAALKVAPNLLGKLESWSDLKKDVKKIWPANFIKQKADRAAVASIIFDETLNNELLSDADILKALTRDQRQIYKEARDAIQVSLENTAKSEMVRKLLAAEAINWSTVESLINQDLPVEQFAQTVRDMVESRIGGFKNELEAILDADPKIKDALKTGNKNKLIPAQKKELKKAKTLKAQIETTEEALKSLNDVENRLGTLIEQGYAPLMRFGEYTLTVRDLDGKVKSFFMFESKSEQVRAVNTIVARYGKTVNLETDMISKEEFKQFAGMTPETVALFAKEIGMDKDEAYQHYLKHAIPARSAMTRMIKRKGTAGFSDDIQRVVASFVMSNARMSAKNIYAAQIEKSIQDIESGKSVKDQAYVLKENVFNPKENFAQLRNILFLWNLGGSIFFGLLNMTQPYMQTLPHLSQYVPIGDATRAILRGSKIAGVAMKNGTAPKGYEAEYNRAVREGVVDPQNVFMLSGVERGKTGASNSAWGVITHTMGLIAQVTESFNRKAVFIAALEVANKKGAVWLKKKGFNSAYDFAKDTVDQTQGVYDKANRSNWANTSVGAPLMVFKQFSINYVEQIVRMWKKEAASGDEGKKAVFLMLAMLASLSGVLGLPFMKDILVDVPETTAAFLGNPVNLEREARLWLGKDIADPLFNGVLNHFVFNQLGVDVQSRTGMGDLVPWTNIANPTLKDKAFTRELMGLTGATGGLINKAFDSAQLAAEGNVGAAAKTLAPRFLTSWIDGGKMALTNEVMDSKGNKLFDTTWDEGLVKFIDANPKRMADLSRTRGLEGKDKAIQAYMTTNFRQKIINAIMDDDKAEVNELMAKVKAWNEARPRYPVFINLNTLSENANKKEQTFDARESIPKGMDWMKNERPEM